MYTVKDIWWQNLRDQFRTQLKKEKCVSGGNQPAKKIALQFYKEMSFMKRFIYSCRYLNKVEQYTNLRVITNSGQ